MSFNKIFLVYNPTSGIQKAKKKAKRIKRALYNLDVECEIIKTATGEEDKQCADKIKHSVNPLVVVLGGDGTLGSVISALISNGVDCCFATYPCGTANDFAMAGHIPKSIKKFVKFLLNAKSKKVDVMLVNNQKYAINAVGAGNFSNGVTNYSVKLKKYFGLFGYYFKCIKEFFHLKSALLTYKTECETFSAETYLYYFVNSKRAGGFNKIAPRAEIDDGLSELIIVKRCSRWACIKVFFDILRGKPEKNKNIITKKVQMAEVSGGENSEKFAVCDIDGFKGFDGKLSVQIEKQKIDFLI